jgi:hypothetical protein
MYRIRLQNPDDEADNFLPRSGRNIATTRHSNPNDLFPHCKNMFAPNKIV